MTKAKKRKASMRGMPIRQGKKKRRSTSPRERRGKK